MASDCQYTHASGMVFKGKHKMLVLNKEVANILFGTNKAIVGFSGNTSEISSVFSWLTDLDGKPPKVKNCELMVLTSNKEIYTNYNLGGWVFVDKPYYSIGSGSHFALGALSSGKKAPLAVEIAMELDPGSGQGIIEIKI